MEKQIMDLPLATGPGTV